MPSKYGFAHAHEQDDSSFVRQMKQEMDEAAARLDSMLDDILGDYAVANSFAGVVDRPDEYSWRLGSITVRIVDHGALSVTVANTLPVTEAQPPAGAAEPRLVKSTNLMALCTVICEQTGFQVVLTAPVQSMAGAKELRGYIWDPADVRAPEQI